MEAIPRDVIVGVIGAGTMGTGIAQVAAEAGHRVRLYDAAEGAASAAIDRVAEQLAKRVRKGKLDETSRNEAMARLEPAAALSEFADCGLVVEAIVEDVGVKQSVFREIEDICGKQTILATNTSSLSVTEIAAGVRRPDNFVGMHFFNPAPVLPLVEIVEGLATSFDVVQTVIATVTEWGRKPVLVSDTPGFIVNRVARPFYAEAFNLLQERAADAQTLDRLYRDCGGFPMGPCELTDLIGQDVNEKVSRTVFEAFNFDARYRPSRLQRQLVAAGRLGRKSGRGFYDYTERKSRSSSEPTSKPKRGRVPESVVLEWDSQSDVGRLEPLAKRMGDAGIKVLTRAGQGDRIHLPECTMAITDGRMATERAFQESQPNLVLFDAAFDYETAASIGLAISETASSSARTAAEELFQTLGMSVEWLDDVPGLVVLRTVAMLANEGAQAVHEGVCDAKAVDDAMRYGTNYPRGPLAWADALSPAFILKVLNNLQAAYGDDRYRASPRLRRLAAAGRRFHEEGSP